MTSKQDIVGAFIVQSTPPSRTIPNPFAPPPPIHPRTMPSGTVFQRDDPWQKAHDSASAHVRQMSVADVPPNARAAWLRDFAQAVQRHLIAAGHDAFVVSNRMDMEVLIRLPPPREGIIRVVIALWEPGRASPDVQVRVPVGIRDAFVRLPCGKRVADLPDAAQATRMLDALLPKRGAR